MSDRICGFPGCGRPFDSRNYCAVHANMDRQGGPLRPIRSISSDPVVRFWSRVQRREPSECWPWMGARWEGYGLSTWPPGANPVNPAQRTARAHRVSWVLVNGNIPDGLHVCHHCDNPPCCNPAHLFLGTRSDNMQDKVAKGRARTNAPKGEAHRDAILTEDQVRQIRQRCAAGETQASLAAEFGVHVMTISQLIRRVTWRHVV